MESRKYEDTPRANAPARLGKLDTRAMFASEQDAWPGARHSVRAHTRSRLTTMVTGGTEVVQALRAITVTTRVHAHDVPAGANLPPSFQVDGIAACLGRFLAVRGRSQAVTCRT